METAESSAKAPVLSSGSSAVLGGVHAHEIATSRAAHAPRNDLEAESRAKS